MDAFNRLMPQANQRDKLREDVNVGQKELLQMHQGTITEAGVRNNMNVSIQYMANWINGNGCVPLFNLMEDAATAEISRSQLWQWMHHGAKTDDGQAINEAFIRKVADEEIAKIHAAEGNKLPYVRAKELVLKLVIDKNYVEFLTLPAYEALAQ